MTIYGDSPKGRSLLYQEILQQPEILANLIGKERNNIARIAKELSQETIRYVFIAARGSSDNAALYGKYLFGAVNRLPVALGAPSLFTLYRQPPRLHQALVIGISQSGESADILEVMSEARRQGVPTLAITNVSDAPIVEITDHQIFLQAGEERSIAATKTYTAQLVSLALLVAAMAQDQVRLAAIEKLPEAIAETLQLEMEVRHMADTYRDMESCVVVGRGYNCATAFEVALKLKELAYVLAEAYSSADFLHGPIALVKEGFPIIAVMPRGKAFGQLLGLLRDLRERGAELIVISDDHNALAAANHSTRLPIPVEEWLSPITAVVPGQLLAYHLTVAKGYDPDHPRGLRKVTLTR